jgi:mannose-6-phosphate isomerase-like protein (cupin superfamily)
MLPKELRDAITNRKAFHGKLELPDDLYPSWDQLVPYFDRSFLNGNKRARDPHKIFVNVGTHDFDIVRYIKTELGRFLNRADISCHCYAGFSPNAIASPPHSDHMEVFFVMIKGSMPWKIFEDGCDYDDKTKTMTSRSTFSKRLIPGDFVYVPTGIPHVALPDSSRVGFSFGWNNE